MLKAGNYAVCLGASASGLVKIISVDDKDVATVFHLHEFDGHPAMVQREYYCTELRFIDPDIENTIDEYYLAMVNDAIDSESSVVAVADIQHPDLQELEDAMIRLLKTVRKFDSQDGQGSGGETWENTVFMIHPYCWCDREDCKWCHGAAPNFHYKPTGFKVWWYKHVERGIRSIGKLDISIYEMVVKCEESLRQKDV